MLRIIISFLLFLCFNSALAKETEFDFSDFKRFAIQSEGRIKPIDTYSKYLLISISGKAHFEDESHVQWFAELLFDPEASANKDIFLINNPELPEALGLKVDKHRRYSFKDLEPHIDSLFELSSKASEILAEDRSSVESEFIQVFNKLNSYIQVSNSFLFNFEHPDFTVTNNARDKLGLDTNHNSLFDIITKAAQITKVLEEKNFNNDTDKEIVRLALLMYDWVERYKEYKQLYLSDFDFDVIPEGDNFVSPWDQLLEPGVQLSDETAILADIQEAYLTKNYHNFELFSSQFLEITNTKHGKAFQLELEVFYNSVKPFFNAKILYGFAFLAILGSLIFPFLKNFAFLLSALALILHSFGLISRILILQRAPVSNLFETFIFVSWIIVLLGLILAFFDKKSSIGLLLASFSGLVLLLISGKFALEGDSMKVLIAVLDSNFWLSTHVIAITIGYAGVFAGGICAHFYLIRQLILKDSSHPELKKLLGISLGLLCFGLCFSFLGTLLGGIWADQSWGRFWGWDPKENGALLIVLWSTLVFHARMAGLVKNTGVALLTAFSSLVVITSWFGINLLGVGLHSYGFTSGIATGLYSYYLLELMFFAGFFLLNRTRDNS